MITCCGFIFTSCSSKSSDTASEDVSLPNKVVPINNSYLFNTIDDADIPLIEDEFSLLLAEVHNDALEYIFDRLETMDFTLFSQTEAENDSLIMELAGQYAQECANSYGFDTTGFYLFNDISETEARQYLEQNASAELRLYLEVVDSLCNTGNFDALTNLYGTYGDLTDDKERLLLKSCISVAQYSHNYWTATNYDATSFWPEDIMMQYQYPENPPLFTDSPREINWNRVAIADVGAAVGTFITKWIVRAIMTVQSGGLSWAELALEIGVHAAVASAGALFVEVTSCSIEVLNTDHQYCYEHDNSIYNFFYDKYQRYGEDYFRNNWNGRFYFMIGNF